MGQCSSAVTDMSTFLYCIYDLQGKQCDVTGNKTVKVIPVTHNLLIQTPDYKFLLHYNNELFFETENT